MSVPLKGVPRRSSDEEDYASLRSTSSSGVVAAATSVQFLLRPSTSDSDNGRIHYACTMPSPPSTSHRSVRGVITAAGLTVSEDPLQRGERAALGRRSRLGRLVRHVRYMVIRALLKVHEYVHHNVDTDGFSYCPAPTSAALAGDLRARGAWYLRPTGRPLDLPLSGEAAGVSYFDDPGKENPEEGEGAVRSPHLLLHSHRPAAVARSLLQRQPVTYVDPDGFNASDIVGYVAVLQEYLSLDEPVGRGCDQLRAALRHEDGKAFVLCTGPSASTLDFGAVEADVRIVCNSAVRDDEILRKLSPNVITFADPVFHFGPSRYASAFRRDLLRAVELTDAWVVVPQVLGRLLLHHHPELERRTVLLEHTSRDWTWPGRDHTDSIRPTDNILTLSMLPLAFALAEHIEIAGCDGRAQGERYFWRHSSRLQYSGDLMRSAWAAHPSFFRDRLYRDYYGRHCDETEALIAAGESAGKTVRSLTASHIPALSKRYTASHAFD